MSINHMHVESMSVMAKTPLELPDGRIVLAGLTIDEKGQIHISFADPDLAATILSEALHNRIINFQLGYMAARPATEGDAYGVRG